MNKNAIEKELLTYLNQFLNSGGLTNPDVYSDLLRSASTLMDQLGNPQNKLKVIHIAGTSGKGSTVRYISNILHSLNYKVGTIISPHLFSLNERIQINNENIPYDELDSLINEIKPAVEYMKKHYSRPPSFYEIMIAAAFLYFYQQNIDVAVVETGLGGKYDGTNTVNREDKICVITKIGMDHQHVLGDTLEQIAGEKAGIIHKGNKVLIIDQPEVNNVFVDKAKQEAATIDIINPQTVLANLQLIEDTYHFDFKYKGVRLEGIELTPAIDYQLENISLSLATVCEFVGDNVQEFKEQINNGIRKTVNLGRFTSVKEADRTFILDGAHNPQKMESFLKSLLAKFPNRKFDFLISFKVGKDFQEMINMIIPHASALYITAFEDKTQGIESLNIPLDEIKNYLETINYKDFYINEDKKVVLEKMRKEGSDVAVVTGSLYLVGKILKLLQ